MPTWSESADKIIREKEHQRQLACAREHRAFWAVIHRLCNFSAFNGYHRTPSDYSLIRCHGCGRTWRTKAAYVAELPDESEYLRKT